MSAGHAKGARPNGGPPRRIPNATQMYAIMTAVKERYTESGLNDKEFAKVISGEINWEVPDSSITTARNAFGIISNKEHAQRMSQVTVIGRLTLLETEVRHLKAEMEELIRFRKMMETKPN